jgi:hypothetical protein
VSRISFLLIAFEGGDGKEPISIFDYQFATAFTLKGQIYVPQSG